MMAFHPTKSSETLHLHITAMFRLAETNSPDTLLVALQMRILELSSSRGVIEITFP